MDPYHRVLGQVVVGSPCNGVELHQVLEVGDLTLDPFLGDRGRPEVSPLGCPSLLSTTGPWPCPPPLEASHLGEARGTKHLLGGAAA